MAKSTIVVVDDDKHFVELLQQYLEAQGYVVYTGNDGQMALPLAKTRRPAVIILDVDMPITNGLKALEHLRAEPQTREIPVILLTGVASGHVYPVIERMPRISHVKKPVQLEDLLSVVRHYLPEANNL